MAGGAEGGRNRVGDSSAQHLWPRAPATAATAAAVEGGTGPLASPQCHRDNCVHDDARCAGSRGSGGCYGAKKGFEGVYSMTAHFFLHPHPTPASYFPDSF